MVNSLSKPWSKLQTRPVSSVQLCDPVVPLDLILRIYINKKSKGIKFCQKLKCSNHYTCLQPDGVNLLIFQILIILSNRIYSLKYLRFA